MVETMGEVSTSNKLDEQIITHKLDEVPEVVQPAPNTLSAGSNLQKSAHREDLRRTQFERLQLRKLVAMGGEVATEPGDAPEGCYRNSKGKIEFDCSSVKWTRHQRKCLNDLNYSSEERDEVVVGTDFLTPGHEDFGLCDPGHVDHIRTTFPLYVTGKAMREAEEADGVWRKFGSG